MDEKTTGGLTSLKASLVAPLALVVVACATADLEQSVFAEEIPFGPESHGLQCRIATVSPESDDESPDFSMPIRTFDRPTDVKMTIPDCTTRPAMISVRADGFEEARFHDVKFSEDETTVLKLERAAPVHSRVIHSVDRSPITNAKVRYFNKTSAKATVGPYPTDELKGPVWATSGEDGNVVLSSLQRVDPYYEKLGDATYFFYIEPADAALTPRFIGPVKAGQDLGDITLGPFLELHGEVHGTPEELARFAAEWDQPFEQKTDNPAATWLYANSQRLKTQRDGDKLIFQLTNLRPGKLRIISNFGPRPHSVQHSYRRREVGETDVLFEVDLEKPSTDVVIKPK